MNEEKMTYTEGGAAANVRWYGVCIHYTSRDLEGLVAALGMGSAGSWVAAELSSLGLIALGIPFGLVATGLGLIAAETALLAWVADGRDVYQHVTWGGLYWYTFSSVESGSGSSLHYSSSGRLHGGATAYGKF